MTYIEIAADPHIPRDERAAALRAIAEEGDENNFSILTEFLKDNDPYFRSSAIRAIGVFGEKTTTRTRHRKVYELLEHMLKDEDNSVIRNTIISMCTSRDSRVLFTLANFYENAKTFIKEDILTGLITLRDPRSKEFLEKIIAEENNTVLKSLANHAWKETTSNNIFPYTFHGPEEQRKKAELRTGQLTIKSQKDLENISNTFERDKNETPYKPQTYIVNLDGDFVIGIDIHEHVEVAKGKEVLTAGEVIFEKNNSGIWLVSYINNRSNGYFPSAGSYKWIEASLKDTDIEHPKDFTERFPRDGYFTEDFLQLRPYYKYHITSS